MGDRHGRQSRLAGIGADGQARIGRASVEVRLGGLAGEMAARYLAGAGVGALKVRSEAVAAAARDTAARVPVEVDATQTSHRAEGGVSAARVAGAPREQASESALLEDGAAAEVLEGALCALRAIKRALEAAR